jgi:hypothetical protein
MTAPQPNRPTNDPVTQLPGFEDIAVHLSQIIPMSVSRAAENPPSSMPTFLLPATPRSAPGNSFVTRVETTPAVAPTSSNDTLSLRQPSQPDHEPALTSNSELSPVREPLHQHRFSSDPRDDVRLQWADGSPEWWHFDVEARMVDRETLWIMEQLEALFHRYLKPIWWDRFVEGVNDFLSMIHKELVHPVWSILSAPFRALAHWIPDIDWPWNFELRGPNVSVKHSPFRRIVFDNQLASQVFEHLWDDPDEFLDAGQSVSRDDFGAVSRVPVHAPQPNGHFENSAIGLMKRFNLRGILHTLTRVLLFTRGSRSWTYGREMLSAGIGTARPLAMVEDRLGPFRFRSFVLTDQVEGTPLPEFLANTALNSLELDRLAGQFARIWHTLGDLRIVHGAMHASNFVVTPQGKLNLINLDGTWRHWFDLTFLHRRDRDWLRFMKAWRRHPEIGAAFRAAVARHFEDSTVMQRQQAQPLMMNLQRAA